MDKVVQFISLKEKLDEISKEVSQIISDSYYRSYLQKNIGMWRLGEAISESAPPESEFNWLKLSQETGRSDKSLKRWHDLYKQYPDYQKYLKEYAEPNALKALERYLKTLAVLQSGTPEWWTPQKYIDAVHKVMGGIDLDPASCKEANETVKAKQFYSPEDDGLSKEWKGRVFLNPPYGDAGPPFIEKLYNSLNSVTEAIVLVNSNSADSNWFQVFFNNVICFTNHRIDFNSLDGEKSSSTHGSCFVYFGLNKEKFAEVFNEFGNIVKKWP